MHRRISSCAAFALTLTLALTALADDDSQPRGTSTYYVTHATDSIPATPNHSPDAESNDATGLTYHTNWWITPTLGDSDYVLWNVIRANIRGHGNATSTDVGSRSSQAKAAWGRAFVTITVPHAVDEEVVRIDVTNDIDIDAAWSVDPGHGNICYADLAALDILGGIHRVQVQERVDVAVAENAVSSESSSVSGSFQAQGEQSVAVGAEASTSGEGSAEGSVESSTQASGSTSGDADRSLSVDRTTQSNGGASGTARYGATVTESVARESWSGLIASWSETDLQATAAFEDVSSRSALQLGWTRNTVTAVGWVRAAVQTPPGEGGTGPSTPPGEGDAGPSTPDEEPCEDPHQDADGTAADEPSSDEPEHPEHDPVQDEPGDDAPETEDPPPTVELGESTSTSGGSSF